jgi:hypothetical protein
MTFGWEAPLTVKGRTVPIDGYDRFDNPWARTPFDSRTLTIRDWDSRLTLDFDRTTREAASVATG